MMSIDNIDVQKLQDEVKKWSDSTFGMHRNGVPIIIHLKAETDELIDALVNHYKGIYANTTENALKKLRKNKDRILMEFADCFMLLIDAAAHEQITIDMLANATKQKLEINKTRKWGKANEHGYFEHIKE
jgi:NTP pyrophosphatase (non-canonical NTP hydrolase)